MDTQLSKLDRNALLPIDWERAEANYATGMTVREVAKRAGCSHTLVTRRAKTHGWARNLIHKVRDRAETIVSKRGVSTGVSTATEESVVSANAEAMAIVMLAHRNDIRRQREHLGALMTEAEAMTCDSALFARARDAIANPGESLPAIVERMAGLVSNLPQRVKVAKDIAETLRTLIALEREALSMDDKQPAPSDPGSFENLVDLATLSIASRNTLDCRG